VQQQNKDYYFSDEEWSRIIGYGKLPDDRKLPQLNNNPEPGEYYLNKSTGDVERHTN
jgi:hypothetical protein